MKHILSVTTAMILAISVSACAKSKIIDGVEYHPYGLLNEDQHKNPKIEYEIVLGNVIWSVILIETIIVPVYMIGFSIKQPVGKKLPENERH